jgi:large subunit ribosomal protein L28
MAKVCAITKKSSQVGGGYSNAVRATQYNPVGLRRRKANLQKKRVFVPELNKTIVLTVSTQGIRTIAKKGAFRALKDAGVI